ncbi:hypothetical protein V6N12_003042 [Hibiscus sabdariffa]|uniref:DUF4283 domain-containing protein n=1 Tax=Hibiscus sabdariffa TaxID=183260 RepID=A0ABR2EC90_9ROSI
MWCCQGQEFRRQNHEGKQISLGAEKLYQWGQSHNQNKGRSTGKKLLFSSTTRRRLNTTFAFVRFSSLWEALNAVDCANNIRMDGFTIKVFLERKSNGDSKGQTEKFKQFTKRAPVSVDFARGRDERSYKEVLLQKMTSQRRRWSKGSLNPQPGCQFSKDQWKRESMLKDWFCDIDSVENFMNEKKLRVWACIEGLPLEVWNESSLVTIASQWGNVIRLDTDTAERNRLDIAKILLGVKGLSSIPPFLSIEVNGVSHFLRVSITEFEDDTCWINGMFEHLVI